MITYKAVGWLRDQYQPVVLVAGTPAAEAICSSKNGLTLVDMLRPFGHVRQLDGKATSISSCILPMRRARPTFTLFGGCIAATGGGACM